mgnify:CR=1 FL=1
MSADSKKPIILVALENELPRNILPDEHIEYTGVGKINAAIKAIEVIQKFNPDIIVNFGTAGSLQKKITGLHEVSIFKQRDMDATGLGFSIGETPFENVSSITFGREGLSCGTGDSFVTEKPKIKTDLVDMEAYAIAKVCLLNKKEFRCFKFVSDNANEAAGSDWETNIKNGRIAFKNKILNDAEINRF